MPQRLLMDKCLIRILRYEKIPPHDSVKRVLIPFYALFAKERQKLISDSKQNKDSRFMSPFSLRIYHHFAIFNEVDS